MSIIELEGQIKLLEEKLEEISKKANIKLDIDSTATQQITDQLRIQDGLNKDNINSVKQLLKFESERLDLQLKKILKNKEIDQEALKQIKNAKESNEIKKKQLEDYDKEQEYLKKKLESNLGIKENIFSISGKYQEIKELSKIRLTQEEAIEIKAKLQNQAFSNITSSIMKMSGVILDKALQFEESSKALMRAGTFTFEEATEGLMAVTSQAAMAGVGLEQASSAMLGLKTSFSGFTSLAVGEATKVTTLVATMERMGVSVNASAKFLDTATKSLGMSTAQATKFLSSLEGFAKKSGIPITQLSKNLEGATDKIALFGQKGTEVFKEMAVVSKQLGIEMNTLFNTTERFTTFEGAADAAGKLNAVLGGDFINSVDLLTASMEDPAEAFKMLKMSMDQSGQSFDKMDNGMKRVIASSIGMTVEQAGKLFSQDINTATAAMREQAKTQEELTKIGAELTTITDKFKNALIKLYPTIKPMIEALAEIGMQVVVFVEELFKMEYTIPILKFVAGATVAIGGAFLAVSTILLPFMSAWKAYLLLKQVSIGISKTWIGMQKIISLFKAKEIAENTAIATTEGVKNAAVSTGIPITTASGQAASSAAIGFIALGAGIFLIGLGIALVIASIALLASQIKDLSGTQMGMLLILTLAIIGAFVGLAIAAVKLSGPMLIAAAVITVFGIAMLIAAIPITIISVAIILMANSLKEMAIQMKGAAIEIGKLGSADMEKRYENMASYFERISKAINSMEIGKLTALSMAYQFSGINASPLKQQGQETELNMTVTNAETAETISSKGGSASSSTTGQVIQINLNIDSPIKLQEEEIGKFTHKEVVNVFADARSPGVIPARG